MEFHPLTAIQLGLQSGGFPNATFGFTTSPHSSSLSLTKHIEYIIYIGMVLNQPMYVSSLGYSTYEHLEEPRRKPVAHRMPRKYRMTNYNFIG